MAALPKRAFPARLLQIAVVVAFLLPTLAHVYAGHYSRYMADDYCFAQIAQEHDIPDGFNYWYTGWKGTYTTIVLLTLVNLPAPQFYGLLIPGLVALWFIASLFAFWQLFLALQLPNTPLRAMLFAVITSYALFAGLPNVVQTIYWVTGAINYFVPLILLALYVALTLRIMRRTPTIPIYVLSFGAGLILVFLAAGGAETYSTLQVTLLALALLGSARAPSALRPRLMTWLASGLICAIIGLLIVLRAPGNAVRASYFEVPAPLAVVVGQSVRDTLAYVVIAVASFSPLALLAALLFSIAVAYRVPVPERLRPFSSTRVRLLLLLVFGAALILIASTIAPSIYVMSAAPPARAFLLAQLVIVVATLLWGTLIGWGIQTNDRRGSLRRSRLLIVSGTIVLTALVIFGPLAAALHTAQAAIGFNTYAAEWDTQDRAIQNARSRGEADIVVAPLSVDMAAAASLDRISTDPNTLANACARLYYHVASVKTE